MESETTFPLRLVPPDVTTLEAENAPIVAEANALVVDSAEADGQAKVLDQRAAAGIRAIEALLDPFISDLHRAHRSGTARREALIGPLKLARSIISEKVVAYEQRAEREAEALRLRLEAEAREEETRRKRADAFAAARAGEAAEAKAILDEPIVAPRVSVAPAVAHVQGSSTRGTWHAEVTDVRALIAYVYAHPELTHLLAPVMSNLDALAKAQKEHMAIPGVRVFESRKLASRAI